MGENKLYFAACHILILYFYKDMLENIWWGLLTNQNQNFHQLPFASRGSKEITLLLLSSKYYLFKPIGCSRITLSILIFE